MFGRGHSSIASVALLQSSERLCASIRTPSHVRAICGCCRTVTRRLHCSYYNQMAEVKSVTNNIHVLFLPSCSAKWQKWTCFASYVFLFLSPSFFFILPTDSWLIISGTLGEDQPASYVYMPSTELSSETTDFKQQCLNKETTTALSPGCDELRCPLCLATFSRRWNLKRHILLHSQQKPYVCTLCNTYYKRLDSLKFHVLTRHAPAVSSWGMRHECENMQWLHSLLRSTQTFT